MSIRFKLQLLLLGTALLPLLLVSWHGYRGTLELGGALAERGRAALVSRMTLHLGDSIEGQAEILRQQLAIAELALDLQALEVERRLAAPEPEAGPLFFAEQYDGDGLRPPGMSPSDRHTEIAPDGSTVPKLVSLDAQNFVLAPGVNRAGVGADLARLSTMLPVYQALHAAHPELFFWHYTAMDTGVHSAYPGHGGYPDDYDPRARHWYRAARDAGRPVWTPANVDASTRQLLVTRSAPVRGPDGTVAGVTGIDLQILRILETRLAGTAVSPDAEAYLVGFAQRPDEGGPGARILAHRRYDEQDWRARVELEWMGDAGTAPPPQVLQDMSAGRSGIVQSAYQGEDSLWAFAPIDDAGTYLLIVLPFSEVATEAARVARLVRAETAVQLSVAGALSVFLVALVLVSAVLGARSVTRPVGNLAGAAKRIAGGDFAARAEVGSGDELGQLARTFNDMVPQLEDRMRVREALALAMEVQQNLLPDTAPSLPGFDVAGASLYCDETGGDYYDFIDVSAVGDQQLGIAVGDVSGHGVAAALLMTTARALLRSRASQAGALGELMTAINRELSDDVRRGRFMTLLYVVLQAGASTVRWVNAGHAPAIVYRPVDGRFEEIDGGGIPLGIAPDWQYEEFSTDLGGVGTVLVTATDGVWESRAPSGEMFGKERLMEVVRAHADESAAAICDAVQRALEAFRDGQALTDDTTLVVIRVTGD